MRPPLLALSRSLWSEERDAHKSRYHMLSRFARDRRVVLLERPFELSSLAKPTAGKLRSLRRALAGARHEPPGIAVITPLAWWLREGDDAAWRVNRALYRPWLRRALRLAGEPPFVWVYDYRYWTLLDGLPRRGAAYHLTEDYAGIAGRGHGSAVAEWVFEQERRLLRRVDLVVAVSEGLAGERRAAHTNVLVAPSGVDLGLYRPDTPCTPSCAEVTALPGPRLGYVGEVNYRLDFDLLEKVADAYPKGTLVLTGRIEPSPAVEHLRRRPNVRMLGHRPPDELAGLIAHLDVCLIPFVTDEWFVRAAQPLKLFEYLACGKPVVSTWLPNLQPWREVVALTRSTDEFVAGCRDALAEESPALRARRLAAAAANSWDTRFDEIDARVRELELRRP